MSLSQILELELQTTDATNRSNHAAVQQHTLIAAGGRLLYRGCSGVV